MCRLHFFIGRNYFARELKRSRIIVREISKGVDGYVISKNFKTYKITFFFLDIFPSTLFFNPPRYKTHVRIS